MSRVQVLAYHNSMVPPLRERSISSAVQDYVKTVYKLQTRTGGAVSTGALAERLEVSPSSVSAMLRKLSELGLVVHQRYHGVLLTESGRRMALSVLRRHRLLELFLSEALGLAWDQVHDEAELLEHALSEQVTDLISSRLGEPTRDPHGDPIPARDGSLDEPPTTGLEHLRPAQTGRLVRVSDADSAVLRQIAAAGIRVGDQLEVLTAPASDGQLTVRLPSGAQQVLTAAAVRAMRVETDPPPVGAEDRWGSGR